MNSSEERWYRALDRKNTEAIEPPIAPPPPVVDEPALPLRDQFLAWTEPWLHDRFFPLDGHWLVRWEPKGEEPCLFRFWLVTDLPSAGPFAPWNPAEGFRADDAIGTFLWHATSPEEWEFVWRAAATDTFAVTTIATARLDVAGLLAVQENDTWRDTLQLLIESVPPSRWSKPHRVLTPVPHRNRTRHLAFLRNRWVKAVLTIVAIELVPSVFSWIIFSDASGINAFFLHQLQAIYTIVLGFYRVVIPILIVADLFHHKGGSSHNGT